MCLLESSDRTVRAPVTIPKHSRVGVRSSVAGLCRQGLTLPASTLDADPLANKTHALELDYDPMGGQIRGKIRRIDPHLRIVWVFIRIVDSRKSLD